MAGLSTALDTAVSSLTATAVQTGLVSRNVAGANDPSYTRKTARLESGEGGVFVTGVNRAMDDALFAAKLQSSSDASGQGAILGKLNGLDQIVLDPEQDASLTANLGKFLSSLETFATSPQDPQAASAAVNRASDVVSFLNSASTIVQDTRKQADAEMTSSVDRINGLLKDFATINGEITSQYGSNTDITTQLDQRDKIVSDLSKELGVRTVVRDHGDMALYTDSGVTLFDKTARTVSLQPTVTYTASTVGQAVYIDGVSVTGSSAAMPLQSGLLVGLSKVRDEIAPQLQSQLDEVARSLIVTFSESDQSGGGGPDVPGIFTYSGAPALPSSSPSASLGLAADIKVSPNALSNPFTLRDGATGGDPAYLYNTSHASGYTDRLNDLVERFNAPQAFSSSTGLQSPATLLNFSASSAGWLEALRSDAQKKSDTSNASFARAQDALSRVVGVNMDTEMSFLLSLEQSYKATSQVIAAIDQMINTLLSIRTTG